MNECKDCIHYVVCDRCPQNDCEVYAPKSRYIELPCAVGDTVYIVAEGSGAIVECTVLGAWVCEDNCAIITHVGTIHNASFGKTVFLTKEEAEKALERSSNEKV